MRSAHPLRHPRTTQTRGDQGIHVRVRSRIQGDSWVQFKVQYYLYALAFVIFDIEVVFLYPWAVAFTDLSFGSFLAMGIFILLLAESLIYLWIKGVLTWK